MNVNKLYELLDNAGVRYEVSEIFEGVRYLRVEVTEEYDETYEPEENGNG